MHDENQIRYLRILVTLNVEVKEALLDVLHDPRFSKLPRDPKKLYVELTNNHKANLDKLLRKKSMGQEEWDLLFPVNHLTDSTKFDLRLCKLLIITCTNLPPPTNGWKKPLDVNDVSTAAFVIRIIQLRNKIMHAAFTLTNAEIENFWNDLETTLNGLGYNKSIAYLKSSSFKALRAHYKLSSEMNKPLRKFSMVAMFIIIATVSIITAVVFAHISKTNNIKRAAIDEAAYILRSYYMKSFQNANLPTLGGNYRLKKRFYIEPSIVEVNGISDDISLKGLLDSYQHDILLLQGAGGIGKTFIMENTALQWARKEIWKDVDFLFLLKFRELVKYRNFEESLIHSYQLFFKKTSIDHLQHAQNKIVFLLDGLDEFVSFNSTNVNQNTCNDSSVLSGIYALLNPDCMVFQHTTIVISGRSSACQQLKSSFKMLFIPTFEVVGFNTEQAGEYIRRYFHHSQTDAETLKGIISSSDRLLMMSKVPASLWFLCEFYQANSQLIKEKKTMTEQTELFVSQLEYL